MEQTCATCAHIDCDIYDDPCDSCKAFDYWCEVAVLDAANQNVGVSQNLSDAGS